MHDLFRKYSLFVAEFMWHYPPFKLWKYVKDFSLYDMRNRYIFNVHSFIYQYTKAAKVDVKEKEEKSCPREGVPTSGSSIFTLRNSQSDVKTPPSNPNITGPELSPFSVPPPPFFTPTFFPPHLTPQYCTTPVANWGYCGGCQCWGPVLPIWKAQS